MSAESRAVYVIIMLLTIILVVLALFGNGPVKPPARECTAIGNAVAIDCKPAKGFER